MRSDEVRRADTRDCLLESVGVPWLQGGGCSNISERQALQKIYVIPLIPLGLLYSFSESCAEAEAEGVHFQNSDVYLNEDFF